MTTKLKRCPTCGEPMQIYRRALSKTVVRGLFLLDNVWPALRKVADLKNDLAMSGIGDFVKLKYWGLIEGDAGFWRITELGRKFIRGQATILKYKWFFKRGIVEQPAEDATVNKALYIWDIGYEPMDKDIAIQNSTPYKTQL